MKEFQDFSRFVELFNYNVWLWIWLGCLGFSVESLVAEAREFLGKFRWKVCEGWRSSGRGVFWNNLGVCHFR